MTHGLVAGRFLPLHAGHLLLIETAARLSDRLTIVLQGQADDAPSVAIRAGWLREAFPAAAVVERLGDAPGGRIDCVFSADPRDGELAAALGARLVLIDPERRAVPLSAAALRADPMTHWWDIAAPARAHFARTICLHGPESTGKSTLAPLLARRLNTCFVPEYGRTYCEQHGLALGMEDLVTIGRTHAAIARAARRRCNRRLILDTDPLMTAAWADMLFGRRDPWFDAFDAAADFYLLLDIDLPWVDDGTRFFGDEARRVRFFDLSRGELERRGLPYAIVGGPRAERLDRALAALATAGLV